MASNRLVWRKNGIIHSVDGNESCPEAPQKYVRNMALIVDKDDDADLLVWSINGKFIRNEAYLLP